jgi:methyl-accepting chemotaxis protein
MGFLGNLRLGPRIGAGFGLCILLLLAVAGVGLANMQRLNGELQGIVTSDWTKAKLVTIALDNTRGSIARLFQMVNDGQS